MLRSLGGARRSPRREVPAPSTPEAAATALLAQGQSSLAEIEGPAVPYRVLARPLPASLAEGLAGLAQTPLRTRAIVRRPAQAEQLVAELPRGPLRDWLAADVSAAWRLFRELAGVRQVFAVLKSERHDNCRRFHVDNTPLRLLVTYAGPGTQLPRRQAPAREALASARGHELDAFNDHVLRAGGGLERVGAGDVVLLKGQRYPGHAPGAGAVHRSPPIEAEGLARLILKLDLAPPPWVG